MTKLTKIRILKGEGVGRGLRFGLIPSPDKCSPCFLKFSQFIYFLWSWKSLVGFIRLLGQLKLP